MFLAWVELAKAGWKPFCPAADFVFFFVADDITEELVKDNGLAWLEASGAVVVLPGWEESAGASAEWERAILTGKKIFYSVKEAIEWIKEEATK